MNKGISPVKKSTQRDWEYFLSHYDNTSPHLTFLEDQILRPLKYLVDCYWIEESRIISFMNQARLNAPVEAFHDVKLASREFKNLVSRLSDYVDFKKSGKPLKGARWKAEMLERDKKLTFYLWCTIQAYLSDTRKTPEQVLSVIKSKRRGEPTLWERIATLSKRPVQWDAGGDSGCGVVEYYLEKFKIRKFFNSDQVKILGFLGVKAVAQVVKLARIEYLLARKEKRDFDMGDFFPKALCAIEGMNIG